MAELRLIGYRFSVYTRVVRMALAEKGLVATYVEVDPFHAPVDPVLARHTPFGRVPVLSDGDFHLYETSAILRYLDGLTPNPPLTPRAPRAAARMQQVMGIVDCYAYPILVRKVFSRAVFGPAFGAPANPERVAEGLAEAAPVLDALEAIAREGLVLSDDEVTQADLHLAPMIACFDMALQGRERLEACPALGEWFCRISRRPSFSDTDPRPFVA